MKKLKYSKNNTKPSKKVCKLKSFKQPFEVLEMDIKFVGWKNLSCIYILTTIDILLHVVASI
jgi:hypothetical protein